MKSWIICFSASSEPCEYRESARSHIMSNARRAWPSQRIAWWMRPGPRRFCARRNPSPGLPMRLARGTRTLS
ncbi:unannotated protein [freshwater metagenome]|uniref:Unannotated protein n=1 Tax=freshwater metagenome TaxID=449393 RepID=A0A6J7PU09_9ZZZZ